ncbi:hypothetical protein MCOR25_009727 [Pyricularia grisea]|nr:hypothetical protein MCOR25_009727 [Pyricularia grisea]
MALLLQYYLVRPVRKMQTDSGYVSIPESKVPMIPIDILPEWIEIVGLPRSLRDNHAVGLTSLGHVEKPEEMLEVRLRSVDPSVHDRAMQYAHVSHLSSGQSGASTINNIPSHEKEPLRTTTGDHVKTATLKELKRQRGERPDGETLTNTTEPGRPNVDAPRKLEAEMPAVQNRQSDEASRSLRAAPQSVRTAAGKAPVYSKRALVAAPNGLSSSVHAQSDPSTEMATKAAGVSAAASPRHQRSAGRATQPFGNEGMRKPTHGARKKTKIPESRRFCHNWCHRGACKWGAECHYLHAMPATRECLREVGLRDYPRWWAELSGASTDTRPRGRTGQSAARRKTPYEQETRPHEPELQREPLSISKRAVAEDPVCLDAHPSEGLSRLQVSDCSGVAHRATQLPATTSLAEGENVAQENGTREPVNLIDLD